MLKLINGSTFPIIQSHIFNSMHCSSVKWDQSLTARTSHLTLEKLCSGGRSTAAAPTYTFHLYLVDRATGPKKTVLHNCNIITWYWSVTLIQNNPLIIVCDSGCIHSSQLLKQKPLFTHRLLISSGGRYRIWQQPSLNLHFLCHCNTSC